MKVLQDNFKYTQKLSIIDIMRNVACFVCIEITIYTVYMKLVRNFSNYIIMNAFLSSSIVHAVFNF